MSLLPDVLSVADLPLPELCAARIDGELFPLAATANTVGWLPVDQPGTAATRAQAVVTGIDPRVIAERLTAAWIHGASSAPPTTLQLAIPTGARFAPSFLPSNTFRQITITEQEIISWAGARCTTPVRTAFDLARDCTIDDDHAVPIIAALLAMHDDPEECVDQFALKPKLPHKRRGVVRLRRALATIR